MVIREIARLLEAEVLVGADKLDQEVDMAFSSDMMSDVLAYVTGSTVLLTGLVNEHVSGNARRLVRFFVLSFSTTEVTFTTV